MPKTARPELPDELNDAVVAFGSHLKVATLRCLQTDGRATRSELSRRLGVSPSTLQAPLKALVDVGAVTTFPPMTELTSVNRWFEINDERIRTLVEALGKAISPAE